MGMAATKALDSSLALGNRRYSGSYSDDEEDDSDYEGESLDKHARRNARRINNGGTGAMDPRLARLAIADWLRDNEDKLKEIIQRSETDEVELDVKDFLQLITAATGPRNAPVQNYFVEDLQLDGEAQKEAAKFKVTLQVSERLARYFCLMGKFCR